MSVAFTGIQSNNLHINPSQANSHVHWNQQKINKLALRILGAIAFGAGISLIGLAAASMLTPLSALGSIPLFILGGLCLYFADKIKDYQDPASKELFRKEVSQSNFTEI